MSIFTFREVLQMISYLKENYFLWNIWSIKGIIQATEEQEGTKPEVGSRKFNRVQQSCLFLH